jgi:hypothetical protein
MIFMTFFARFALVVCVAAFSVASVRAQSETTAPAALGMPPVKSSPRTSTRTVTATITALNGPARSIGLRILPDSARLSAAAEEVVAVQDVTCRPLKNGRAATLAEFAVGETVVARLTWRTTPERVVVLRDLYDAPAYAERQRQGKEICVGTVDAFSATELSVRRTDGKVIAFRVTDKTHLVKNDAPATITAFGVGTPVAVKPRRLPSGDLQAAIVGGTAQEVNWAYRDTLTTWSGSVIRVQGDEQNGAVISMHREDGAKRQFFLPVGATFQQGRSVLPWRLLPGASISAHMVKATQKNGMRYADEVKIASRRSRKTTEDTVEEP